MNVHTCVRAARACASVNDCVSTERVHFFSEACSQCPLAVLKGPASIGKGGKVWPPPKMLFRKNQKEEEEMVTAKQKQEQHDDKIN